MDFCKICNNMYYIKIENEDCDTLIYYCRKCGNEDNTTINMSKSILKQVINGNNDSKSTSYINKYTKFDRTLPRINYIKCPNSSCVSNNNDFDANTKEIIYIRYDNISMKFLYLCSHCNTSWKTEK